MNTVMMIMENQEMQESYSSLPVLPRLDRLDRLVQLLVEKHGLSGSGRYLCKNEVQKKTDDKQEEEEEDKFKKTLSSVLDEVQHKGSLLDRLSILENRVLQLSLDMDERNKSKSSSTVAGSETSTGNSGGQEKEQILMLQGMKTSPHSIKEQDSRKTCGLELKGHNNSRRQSYKKPYKKRLGWLRLGC